MLSLCSGILGIFLLIGGQNLLRRGRGGKMTRDGLVAVGLGALMLGCAATSLCQLMMSPFTDSSPLLPTLVPTASVPTVERSYHIEYYIDFNAKALCTSDALALETLELTGIPIEYTDFSTGERELRYVNQLGRGLRPSAFPWTYKFTLRKHAGWSGHRLYVQGEAPVTTLDSCHALTCKIIVNGREAKSGTSIVRDVRGNDRATQYAECSMWVSDLDW